MPGVEKVVSNIHTYIDGIEIDEEFEKLKRPGQLVSLVCRMQSRIS